MRAPILLFSFIVWFLKSFPRFPIGVLLISFHFPLLGGSISIGFLSFSLPGSSFSIDFLSWEAPFLLFSFHFPFIFLSRGPWTLKQWGPQLVYFRLFCWMFKSFPRFPIGFLLISVRIPLLGCSISIGFLSFSLPGSFFSIDFLSWEAPFLLFPFNFLSRELCAFKNEGPNPFNLCRKMEGNQ